MATQSRTTQRSTNDAKAKAAKPAKAAAPERNQARSVAETAVDIPVGVVLGATDRLTDVVEPFTDRSGAEKQLKDYRTRLRRSLKRTERRGSTARRKATTAARKRTQGLVDQVGEQLSALR